jgi:hypothetical protein
LSGFYEKNIKLKIMNSVLKKVLTYLILPLVIVGLTAALVNSIMEPVHFNKHKAYRESVAVQRLKDIRDLQVAYKNVNGKYSSTIDSLKLFYNEGKMKITMQVGSKDDSLAMAHTEQLKKKFRNLTAEKFNAKLHELYLAGEQNLVFQVVTEIPVKDTIFHSRTDFNIDDIQNPDTEEKTIQKLSDAIVELFKNQDTLKKYQLASYETAIQFLNENIEEKWIRLLRGEESYGKVH